MISFMHCFNQNDDVFMQGESEGILRHSLKGVAGSRLSDEQAIDALSQVCFLLLNGMQHKRLSCSTTTSNPIYLP